MHGTPTCLVCQKVMERGFVIDPQYTMRLPIWYPGAFRTRQSFLFGQVIDPPLEGSGLPVVAYRCPECHALRLYAPSTEAKP